MYINRLETTTKRSQIKPELVFAQIADEPGAIWLDSSLSMDDKGERSFIAHNPILEISLNGDVLTEKITRQEVIKCDRAIVYDILEQYVSDSRLFAVGYIDYESSLDLLGVQSRHKSPTIPSIRFLFYDSHISYDHKSEDWLLHGTPDNSLQKILDQLRSIELNSAISNTQLDTKCRVVSTESFSEYCKAIDKISKYIYEGDIYQANYTTRFNVQTALKPFDLYCKIREMNKAPYSCYLNFGTYQVLSSSPERLFIRKGGQIQCGPIKGTIGCLDSHEDRNEKSRQLQQSSKDRAELLMIVDLVRNDLGKIAKAGSVKVDSIFKPEVYASLIHLVSDISAELKSGVSYTDIFKALLPAGSITGAPKKRAVEIINELEYSPRSIYTGAIGYINGDRADFNLAIRTIVHQNSQFTIAGGGGIVADSQAEHEYNEMRLKVRKLFEAVGAII